jgi:phosphoribosylglycinamide formyltransferase-1
MNTVQIGVLGSTRGTDLQAIIDAIQRGELDARINLVISNKSKAYILERARQHGIQTLFIGAKDKTLEEHDREISYALKNHQVELILLIGYMRILSRQFVQEWQDRVINVHPSLLPAFAGGMDTNVHEEVLKSGVKETGCTIHIVTEEVDAGPILLQKSCPVFTDDTADTLKARVQALEEKAFIEVIQQYQKDRFAGLLTLGTVQ